MLAAFSESWQSLFCSLSVMLSFSSKENTSMGIDANTYSKETFQQRICFAETEGNHLMQVSLLQKLLRNTFYLPTHPQMLRILRCIVPKTSLHKHYSSFFRFKCKSTSIILTLQLGKVKQFSVNVVFFS